VPVENWRCGQRWPEWHGGRSTRVCAKNYFIWTCRRVIRFSQYELPLATARPIFEIEFLAAQKKIGITSSLEEDAAKNLHEGFKGFGHKRYVDYNERARPLKHIRQRNTTAHATRAYAKADGRCVGSDLPGVSDCKTWRKVALRCAFVPT